MDKALMKIDVASLKSLAAEVLRRAGVPDDEAVMASDILVEADMMGIGTHGVLRLEGYVGRMRSGGINPAANITQVRRSASLALVDGADGLGPVVGGQALDLGIEMSKESGIAYIGCRNSNHFGALAPYAFRACEAGLVFIGGTNASTTICPWGGKEARLGNNPMSIAAPRMGAFHFILDMAMSVAARGKIRAARDKGEAIPEGWAIDKDGRPATDPVAALGGYLLPVGGHKGSGLSMAIDILSGVLTGGRFLNTVASWVDTPELPSGVGHFFLLIDPDRLIGNDIFLAAMDSFCNIVLSTPAAEESAPVTLPGYGHQKHRQQVLEHGVEIPAQLLDSLRVLAAS